MYLCIFIVLFFFSGEWHAPDVTGQCMLPGFGFIAEKISNTRAVLFGGVEYGTDEVVASSNIYMLEIIVASCTVVCLE